ncbi:MAG: D-alanine--D-alanine ligase, partial [Oscillochloris sp.]|nr:D-alanine--D-alanine ligase [Oscillochloris sp.]
LAGLPYVGCGVAASAVGMDKALMKAAFAAAGLPLLPWLLVRRVDWQKNPEATYAAIEDVLYYPVFVKPANMGSSVGVGKAKDRAGLEQAIAEAARYDRRIVVEQGISAREIEISVLGNEAPEASVPGEVVPSGEWYDYNAKYIDGQSAIHIPAPIDAALAEQVRELALHAFLSIDGTGLARADFLLDKETGQLWINEVNTMPGFTPISMYAKMWAASGLSYPALLDRLIDLALERKA